MSDFSINDVSEEVWQAASRAAVRIIERDGKIPPMENIIAEAMAGLVANSKVWVIGDPVELHRRKESALAAIQRCIVQDAAKFSERNWKAIDCALKAHDIELALHLYQVLGPAGNPRLYMQEQEIRQ